MTLSWPFRKTGMIQGTRGIVGIASSLALPPGQLCRLGSLNGPLCESIGFSQQQTLLMALDPDIVWTPGSLVYEEPYPGRPDASQFIGRVVDGLARPLDGGPSLPFVPASFSEASPPTNPLLRRRLQSKLDVGIRAVNGLLPVAQGQRLGLFAGSGVGKSTLLSMMAKHTQTDRVVLALIGERSREVREFIEDNLGADGLARSAVIAVTAGQTPLMKTHAAHLACDIADEFKRQGHSCLLIMDSLTRYAMACREIGLACGEAPAGKGYPPSVFSKVNALVERAGPGNESLHEGNITSFYTVLSEGDDLQDPVADNARAILDGHIVLNRAIADQGIYPPIDVAASVSRAASIIASPEQLQAMKHYRQLLATYTRNEDLIKAGAYQRGSDPLLDQAIDIIARLRSYVTQGQEESYSIEESLTQLYQLFSS